MSASSQDKWERRYREQHSTCGGFITILAVTSIGPVLFCSCQADDPEGWAEFVISRKSP